MKIGQQFNKLTHKEYFFYIDNYKKYTDFNTLGLYRSIIENDKLNIDNKIEVREYAHKTFKTTFDFLQLKDPETFFGIATIGLVLTIADEKQIWTNIITNQQKILKNKRIKHRNFGSYSKHNCGYETCPLNGLMIKSGSLLENIHMQFNSDKNQYLAKIRSDKRKFERKSKKNIIQKNIDNE